MNKKPLIYIGGFMDYKDFLSYLDNSEETRDKYVRKCTSLIMMYFNKHKSKVSMDEREDLIMDLICQVYSAYDDWDEVSNSSFCTFVYFKLMDWEKHLLTKYTGIKVSRNDLKRSKIEGKPVVLTKIQYENQEV